MAERRMFAKTIIDSDAFLDMPLSAQALYFHLSMRADDDGFINNPKKIQRMVGAADDDLKLLLLKRFVIGFESGVVVIKHWKIHNYIQKDRYKPTIYKEEMAQLSTKENRAYTDSVTECIQDGYTMETQVRLGKSSLELGESSVVEEDDPADEPPPPPRNNYQAIQSLYNSICKSLPRCTSLSDARKKAIAARINSGYTEDDFKRLFEKAESSRFLKGSNPRNWTANFDWLIKDANMAKVLDGNYDNKEAARGATARREEVPEWMTKYAKPKKTAGEDPAIRARAEQLQRELKGDNYG